MVKKDDDDGKMVKKDDDDGKMVFAIRLHEHFQQSSIVAPIRSSLTTSAP
jgi:hypothetical protein